MRAVIQRSIESDVTVEGRVTGSISAGLVVLLGVEEGDTKSDASYMADKICGLRIFNDGDGKMNLCIKDFPSYKILAISQFTLLGDVRHGRRPSFITAAKPDSAKALCQSFVEKVKEQGIEVEEGEFQADMCVRITNDGPVTILIDSKKAF